MATAVELPRTPTRALSSDPPRSRRDSREDADSSATRKRPRLDHGETLRRSMSADAVIDAARPEDMPTTPTNEPDLSQASQNSVTLSLRSPHSAKFVDADQAVNVDEVMQPEGAEDVKSEELPNESGGQRNHGEENSTMSSPERTPEIEVAEVEDMDDDPSQSTWTSMVNVNESLENQEDIMEKFPFMYRSHDIMVAARTAVAAFEKGKWIRASKFDGFALTRH